MGVGTGGLQKNGSLEPDDHPYSSVNVVAKSSVGHTNKQAFNYGGDNTSAISPV